MIQEHLHGVWDIPARGSCWLWQWELILPYMLGNLLTATAYFYTPFLLWRIAKGRPGKWLTGDVGLAAAFIVLCGAGHFIGGVLLVFWGLYPFAVAWDFLTGLVSWAFAVRLKRKFREIIDAPDMRETLKLKEDLERAAENPPPNGEIRKIAERAARYIDRTLVLQAAAK